MGWLSTRTGWRAGAAILTILLVAGCAPTARPAVITATTGAVATASIQTGQPVTLIPLAGPASRPEAEFSGLAWWGDTLFLLPQYPSRFGSGGEGALLALPRSQILDYLDGRQTSPLQPREVPLQAPGLGQKVPGWQGFEAIAFDGEAVFLTIEAMTASGMMGYLIRGTLYPDQPLLELDMESLAPIQPQAKLANRADEAIVIYDQRVYTIYEANGKQVNPAPMAHGFDFDLTPLASLPLENIEYRITDASEADAEGRFWALNTFYPGDRELAAPDTIRKTHLYGYAQNTGNPIERLIQLRITADGIQLETTPPLNLYRLVGEAARNWEGLVELEGRGFLLVTDKFPTTIFGFVPYPEFAPPGS